VAPSNTYECADGRYVVISGNSDAIFARLMRLIGRPDLAEDPALAGNSGRVPRAAELDAAIGAWTGKHDQDGALAALEAAEVPSGPINAAADILRDPQFRARRMHERHAVEIAPGREVDAVFPAAVPKLARRPGGTRRMAPRLGEHTDEVLAELGADPAALRAAGAV
jgi:crotonobetainyl-CoA:carnitine CoA-transferase CaiB-like acyl-CoA transferase